MLGSKGQIHQSEKLLHRAFVTGCPQNRSEGGYLLRSGKGKYLLSLRSERLHLTACGDEEARESPHHRSCR